MSREIEAKFKLTGPDELRTALKRAGAQQRGRVLELNRLFDFADRRLLAAGAGLRVRAALPEATREGGLGQPPELAQVAAPGKLTFKGPRAAGTFKSREEIETTVGDAETLLGILHALGLNVVLGYEKRRETWWLDPCLVVLDELPRLGWFAEIEGPNEPAVQAARLTLGLAAARIVEETYPELVARCCGPAASSAVWLQFEDANS